MDYTDFGFFVYHPDPGGATFGFRNELGQDWYELRAGLTTWGSRGEFIDAVYGTWVALDADGVVTNVESDPSRLMPGDRTVLGLDTDPETIVVGSIWKEATTSFDPPIPRIIIKRYSKMKLFEAMTDAEYDTFEQVEAQQNKKERRVFREATDLMEGAPGFDKFKGVMVQVYGQARTDALLTAAQY